MVSKKDPPFLGSIRHLMSVLSIDYSTAMDKVDGVYKNFKGRNQKLLERQNDQSNAAQIQLISHFALLATLTLTVTGFLLTQTTQQLTDGHKILILCILVAQTVSLFFGACDYLQTIRFHMSWAKLYQSIDEEVNEKFNSGELQQTSQLNKIESKHLKDQPDTTKMWVTIVMVGSCLFGLLLLLVLFYSYFFDVPIIG